jgi:hypothetical protein
MARPDPNTTRCVIVTLSGWLFRVVPLLALHNKPGSWPNGMKLRQSIWQHSYRFKYSHCKTLAISGQYGLNFMPFGQEP